jgi:hypothetical protein
MIMIKCLNSAHDWCVYHKGLTSSNYHLVLNEINAEASGTEKWQNTDPSSTVFTLGNGGGVNANTQTHVAYCFADVQGYSKFGSYVGNGSTDGTFIYTGFKPAFIIIKATSGTENWRMYDNKRNGFNVDNEQLFPNVNNAEASDADLDILSNGFKCRRNSGGFNNSGTTYIYMAFAESPFVTSTGISTTAR